MSMEQCILAAFGNFLRALVIWRFIRVFFAPAVARKKEMLGYVCYFLVTLAVYLQFQFPLFNMVASWLGLVLLTGMYQGSWKKKCLVGTMIYALNGACDAVAVYLYGDFSVGGLETEIVSVFTALFLYICEIFVEKFMGKRGKEEPSSVNMSLICVPVVSAILLLVSGVVDWNHQELVVLESVSILIINVVIFFIYEQLSNAYREQLQREQMEKQVRMYQNQLELLQDSKRKVQSLRHDMRHHLKSLYVMTKEGQQEKVLQYIEEMQVSLENPKQHVTTGNAELDAILNYSWDKAERLGIRMECKTSVSPSFSVSMYELSIILGNLLENAMEAAAKTKNPYISLKLIGEKEVLAVQVKNSYNGSVKKKGTQFVSTKEGKGHGVGLQSVQNLVEQKKGSVQISHDEKEFRVEVMIYV